MKEKTRISMPLHEAIVRRGCFRTLGLYFQNRLWFQVDADWYPDVQKSGLLPFVRVCLHIFHRALAGRSMSGKQRNIPIRCYLYALLLSSPEPQACTLGSAEGRSG